MPEVMYTLAAAPAWLFEMAKRPEKSAPAENAKAWLTPCDLNRYVQKAVESEIAILAGWQVGQKRNDRLNKAAYALRRFVGAGALPESEARRLLIGAAQQCGTWQDKGESQTLATIESGLQHGKQNPAMAHLKASEPADRRRAW